jgi:1,2-diacylglycerol 3-beta-glucosyltransferase
VIGLVFGVFSLFIIAAGVLYFCSMMLLGWWEGGHPLAHPTDDDIGRVRPSVIAVLIPCLNEQLVIGETVRALRMQELPQGVELVTIVIDDGSDDATSSEARIADPSAMILRRELPGARQGKGAALNDAYRMLTATLAEYGVEPERVVVCVIDADGRLSPGAFVSALDAMADRSVGGVQLPVRIRNRTSWLTEIQDLEFWGFSATTQVARRRTGTVSLGGNGQFTRLAALASLGGAPWSSALTEDLDLAVSLALEGWKLTTVTDAFVDQQAVTTVSALMRQRTRWFQGHMTCAKRIPELLMCPKISSPGAIEMSAYLLVPFVLTLPWSLVGQWALAMSLLRLYHGVGGDVLGHGVLLRFGFAFAWYVAGFFPTLTLAGIYRRRARCTRRHALALGHLLLLYNYLMYVAAWKALWRMVHNRDGWSKTERTAEGPQTQLSVV